MKSWELERMWKEEARKEGLAEGRQEGSLEAKQQFILELLRELGDIPDTLREKISCESQADILARWHKLAAKSNSISEFKEKM